MASGYKMRRTEESDLVSPRDFMTFWNLEAHEVCRVIPPNFETIQSNIESKMNVSKDTVAELEEVCGKKSLFTGNEPKKKDNLYRLNEMPADVELKCLKYQLESNKKREESSTFSQHVKGHMKYFIQDSHLCGVLRGAKREDIEEQFRIPLPNVLLTVKVKRCQHHGMPNLGVREQNTYLVLGSQALTELRDKIFCSSDNVIPGDYSSVPDIDPRHLQTTGDMFKSSFFLFEDVFYNDTRQADSEEYSKPIIEWAKTHMPDKAFTTKEMAKTTFFDLHIRLGQHYLFTHQGNCEHSVLFTDIRLFNATDNQDKRLYPILAVAQNRFRVVCQACTTLTAKWSVTNSTLIPFEPTLLCGSCFKSLQYTKDGKKISDFKAFHFVC